MEKSPINALWFGLKQLVTSKMSLLQLMLYFFAMVVLFITIIVGMSIAIILLKIVV